MLHPQIGCRIGIHYPLIDRFPDRRSFDKEENLGAWCWDHTYKTYDRRVWSSCARVEWFSWLVFSSRFSPETPTARQHHQPNYRCCFHLWAPDPVELYVLKQNFFPPALIKSIKFLSIISSSQDNNLPIFLRYSCKVYFANVHSIYLSEILNLLVPFWMNFSLINLEFLCIFEDLFRETKLR